MRTVNAHRARSDVAYFAEHLLGYRMHRYQVAPLEDDHDTVVWAAGRGAGKTYTAMTYALWRCYTNRDYRVVYIAARMGQAKIAWDVAVGMLQGTPLAADIVELSTERIRLSNGSAIHFIPGGNPVAARGFHNAYVRDGAQPGISVLIDEAASVSRETYVAAQNIINTAPRGKRKMLIVGSPLGTNHWFFAEYTAGMDKRERFTAAYHTPSTACPHVSGSYLAQQREKLSDAEYGAEILAEFQESLDSYFGGIVDKVAADYSLPLPPLSGMQYGLGIDLSSSARIGSDWTVLVVACRWWGAKFTPRDFTAAELLPTPAFVRIAEVRRFQYLSQSGLKAELLDLLERYPALRSGVVESYEATQLEEFCKVVEGGEVRSLGTGEVDLTLERITPSNPIQRESFGHFHRLLRNGELELPQDGPGSAELLRELKAFTYRMTEAGNLTFGAPSGFKDDVAYATNWALWSLRHRKITAPRNAYEPPPLVVCGRSKSSEESPQEVYR